MCSTGVEYTHPDVMPNYVSESWSTLQYTATKKLILTSRLLFELQMGEQQMYFYTATC